MTLGGDHCGDKLLQWADVWACPSRVNLRLSDWWLAGEYQLNEGSDFRIMRKKL